MESNNYHNDLGRLAKVVLLLFGMLGALSSQAQERHNIVWITVEDMSPRLGAYGDSIANTPNIDQLAMESVRYNNAYATYGVCAPSRHTLITGMYPTSTGAMAMRTWKRTSALKDITDPELLNIPVYEATPPVGVKCFSEYFRAAGYYCTNNEKTDYQFQAPITAWDDSSDSAHWRNRPDKNTPFFAVFNSMLTHESGTFKQRSPIVTNPVDVIVPPYYQDTETVRADLARHYDNIHAMDKWVGQLMQELKEDGLLENTIVIFFSDHGDGLPRAKRWVYDSGIKVPFMIRWPDGHLAGTSNEELISFVDFAPMTLAMAELPILDYMEGIDFLNEDKSDKRKYIYAFRDRMDPAPERIRAVRDNRFKYVRNYRPDLPYLGYIPYRDRAAMMKEILELKSLEKLGEDQWQFSASNKPLEELYDTQKDPHEIDNLASNPNYFEKLAELRTAHEQFREKYGDLGEISEYELIKKLWPPDGIQPTVAIPQATKKKNSVTLTSETAGASIAYRIENEQSWKLYSEPIQVKRSQVLEAMACRIGWKPSKVAIIKI